MLITSLSSAVMLICMERVPLFYIYGGKIVTTSHHTSNEDATCRSERLSLYRIVLFQPWGTARCCKSGKMTQTIFHHPWRSKVFRKLKSFASLFISILFGKLQMRVEGHVIIVTMLTGLGTSKSDIKWNFAGTLFAKCFSRNGSPGRRCYLSQQHRGGSCSC